MMMEKYIVHNKWMSIEGTMIKLYAQYIKNGRVTKEKKK